MRSVGVDGAAAVSLRRSRAVLGAGSRSRSALLLTKVGMNGSGSKKEGVM